MLSRTPSGRREHHRAPPSEMGQLSQHANRSLSPRVLTTSPYRADDRIPRRCQFTPSAARLRRMGAKLSHFPTSMRLRVAETAWSAISNRRSGGRGFKSARDRPTVLLRPEALIQTVGFNFKGCAATDTPVAADIDVRETHRGERCVERGEDRCPKAALGYLKSNARRFVLTSGHQSPGRFFDRYAIYIICVAE